MDDEDGDDDKRPKRKLQPGGKDPWLDGSDPWSSARFSAKGQPLRRSSSMSKRPRNHAADTVYQLQVLDEKVDHILAGMALAIGPGFEELLNQSRHAEVSATPQPEQEPSPLKVNSALAEYTSLPPRCLVFAMSDGDDEDVAYSEAARLDLEGDFSILSDVFGQQYLESNASTQVECDAQSIHTCIHIYIYNTNKYVCHYD